MAKPARSRRAGPKRAKHDLLANADIETLIAHAHGQGLYVNNLYEIRGGWRANMTDERDCFGFGDGKTATDALRAALAKAKVS